MKNQKLLLITLLFSTAAVYSSEPVNPILTDGAVFVDTPAPVTTGEKMVAKEAARRAAEELAAQRAQSRQDNLDADIDTSAGTLNDAAQQAQANIKAQAAYNKTYKAKAVKTFNKAKATAAEKIAAAQEARQAAYNKAQLALALAQEKAQLAWFVVKTDPKSAAITALAWAQSNASDLTASTAALIASYQALGKTILKPKAESYRVTNAAKHAVNAVTSLGIAAFVFNKGFGQHVTNFVAQKVAALKA